MLLSIEQTIFDRIKVMLKKPATKRKHSYRSQLKKIQDLQTKHHLFFQIEWLNPQATKCKVISKDCLCFCGHLLQKHTSVKQQSLECTTLKCKCKAFCFMPSLSLKCICKHSPAGHHFDNKKCRQCTLCIGFASNWACKCGFRYQQHYNNVIFKPNKQNQHSSLVSLPKVSKTLNISYPKHDKIKQMMTASLFNPKFQNSIIDNDTNYDQQSLYLKQKLRQANLRFFSKFKYMHNDDVKQENEQPQKMNALDLYVQPHNYRDCSLTKVISNMLKSKKQ